MDWHRNLSENKRRILALRIVMPILLYLFQFFISISLESWNFYINLQATTIDRVIGDKNEKGITIDCLADPGS